jgi:hypothetical protein
VHCVNPHCRAIADNLLRGTLRLVEFETSPEDRLLYASGGFPVCSARSRYFWLCEKCSKRLTIRKWDSTGLILGPLFEVGNALCNRYSAHANVENRSTLAESDAQLLES